MEITIDTGERGEVLAVFNTCKKLVQTWHPETKDVHVLSALHEPPQFGTVAVCICVNGADYKNICGGNTDKCRKDIHENHGLKDFYLLNTLFIVMGDDGSLKKTREDLKPEDREKVKPGSVVYYFAFQTWETMEILQPELYFRHFSEPYLKTDVVKDYSILPYTPANAKSDNDRGQVVTVILDESSEENPGPAGYPEAVNEGTFWEMTSYSYQATTGTAAVLLIQFRVNLDKYSKAERVYRQVNRDYSIHHMRF